MKIIGRIPIFIFACLMCTAVNFSFALPASSGNEFLSETSLADLLNLTIVTNTGFFPMESRKAPGHTFVLSADQVNRGTARSIQQLLDVYVPGTATTHHFFGSLVGQRGVMIDSNAKTLVTFAGKNLNARSHFGTMLPLDSPLTGDIHSMEIIQGPGAIPHGSGAISGVVGLNPKTGTLYQGFRYKADYGFAENSRQFETSWGKVTESGDLFVYAGTVAASGYVPNANEEILIDTPNQPAWETSLEERIALLNGGGVRAHWWVPGKNYKFMLNWNHNDFSLVTQYMHYRGNTISSSYRDNRDIVPDVDPLNWPIVATWGHNQLTILPKYTVRFSDKTSLELNTSIMALDNGRYHVPDDVFIDDRGHNSANEIEYAFKPIFRTQSFDQHSLAIGMSYGYRKFEYQDPFFSSQGNDADYDLAFGSNITPHISNHFSWKELALFAEDTYQFNENLLFSLGVRYDRVDYDKDTIIEPVSRTVKTIQSDHEEKLVPRLTVSYDKNKHSLKYTYQEGFRHPDVSTMQHGSSQPTVDVSTEFMTSHSITHVYQYENDILPTVLTSSVYLNKYEDTIGWNAGSFENLPGIFKSIGGEIEFSSKFNQGFLSGSFSYSRPSDFSEELQNGGAARVIEVNESRSLWGRYPRTMLKLEIGKWLKNETLLLQATLNQSEGTPKIYNNGNLFSPHPAFRGDKTHLNFAAYLDASFIQPDAKISFIMQNVTGEENSLPPFNGSKLGKGHQGIDERLMYITFESKF